MSSFPYVGLDEIKNDKIGTLKALFAEFIGTGILVKLRDILVIEKRKIYYYGWIIQRVWTCIQKINILLR